MGQWWARSSLHVQAVTESPAPCLQDTWRAPVPFFSPNNSHFLILTVIFIHAWCIKLACSNTCFILFYFWLISSPVCHKRIELCIPQGPRLTVIIMQQLIIYVHETFSAHAWTSKIQSQLRSFSVPLLHRSNMWYQKKNSPLTVWDRLSMPSSPCVHARAPACNVNMFSCCSGIWYRVQARAPAYPHFFSSFFFKFHSYLDILEER